MRKLTIFAAVIVAGLIVSFSAIYEFTTSPSTPPLTEASLTTSPLTGLRAEILDAPTQAAPGEELSLHVRVYKPNGMALPSAQLYAYLYCYQLGLGGCLNAGPGDWRDWVINRIDIVQIDPAYSSMEAHENIFELKLRVKENALAYLDIAGVADVSLRARLRVPCSFELDENGENVNVTVREKKFSVPIMDKRVYTSETKYSLREQGANPSLDLSSKGRLDCDFTVRDFLIGEAIAPEPLPAVLPRLTDLRVELLNAPTGVRPGEEFSLRVRVRKPEGMTLPNAELYAYLYCPRLGLEGCLNSAPEGFINWTANAINITVRDPNFRRVRAHENTFELRIRVKENALEYLELQGANYVRLRARLRMPVAYSPTRRDISIEMGAQKFTTPVLVEKHYEGETQYYLSNELEVGNDIHVGSKGNLDYDATVTVVLSEGEQLTRAERALRYVSRAYGIPRERLIFTSEQDGELRTVGLKFWQIHVLDPITKNRFDVFIDELGNIVNERELRERERRAALEKYGKLSNDLYEFLENTNTDEKVKVWVWLADVNACIPRLGPGEAVTEEVENVIATATENFKRAIELRERPVIDFLHRRGFEVIYASRYAPLIFVELPRQIIFELQERDDVIGIYRRTEGYVCELDTATRTVRADEVWNQGYAGYAKVAIVEDDGIDFSNPYLEDGARHLDPYDNGTNRAYLGDHATAVAGIVASTCSNQDGKDYRGVAWTVPPLLSANFRLWYDEWSQEWLVYDSEVIEAVEWALDHGADILNLSFGKNTNLEMQMLDRFLDYVVEHLHKTVAKAAGNISYDPWNYNPEGNITSPGLGYNVITVGAFDDNDTGHYWPDDTMWPSSCFRNPRDSLGREREKPEVVAVGARMYSTLDKENNGKWIGFVDSGTSFAAPAVAGEAALLMDRAEWLKSWPEAVKAVIMASAVHNIEGWRGLSEMDGAGAIDCYAAYGIVNENQVAVHTFPSPSGSWDYSLYAYAGERVRVAICWDSHTSGGYPPTYDEPGNNLYLDMYGPSTGRGEWVLGFYSTDAGRTFQIVDFQAPYTGWYIARVSFGANYGYTGSERVGLAYCIMAQV